MSRAGRRGWRWTTRRRWSSCALVPAVALTAACYSTTFTADASTADASIDNAPVPASYADIVLNDHPVGYWRLGDRDTMAADISGGGTPGTYGSGITQGVPGAISDQTDSAAEFDGRAGVISVGSGFDFRGAFSIEAWIRPTMFDQFRHVFTRELRVERWQGYALLVNAQMEVVFERFVDNKQVVASSPIMANRFSHVVATYDSEFMQLYVNGQQVQSVTAMGEQPAAEALTLIGAATLSQGFFAGAIDEVAVYSTALSAAHIAMHYQVGTMP